MPLWIVSQQNHLKKIKQLLETSLDETDGTCNFMLGFATCGGNHCDQKISVAVKETSGTVQMFLLLSFYVFLALCCLKIKEKYRPLLLQILKRLDEPYIIMGCFDFFFFLSIWPDKEKNLPLFFLGHLELVESLLWSRIWVSCVYRLCNPMLLKTVAHYIARWAVCETEMTQHTNDKRIIITNESGLVSKHWCNDL